MVRMMPDQITVKRSEMLAKEKNERYQREAGEVGGDYSKLETAIALLLGIIVIGFVIFVLSHYL